MTIQKRDKKKKRTVRVVAEKATPSPPADKMVKPSDKCAWCGRKMLDVRCQCGYVRPRNK